MNDCVRGVEKYGPKEPVRRINPPSLNVINIPRNVNNIYVEKRATIFIYSATRRHGYLNLFIGKGKISIRCIAFRSIKVYDIRPIRR